MHLSDLKQVHVSQLLEMAEADGIENANRMRKQELIFALLKSKARLGETIHGDGVLEILPDGFGFLRSAETSYLASPDDIYISPSQVRRFNLHTGDTIEGEIRTPKDGERYFAITKLDKVNGESPEGLKHKILFENLTPLFPNERFVLERDIKGEENLTGRIIDIVAPIGKGSRGLIVAPPKSGKTVMLQHIAHAIVANHPEAVLIVLLIDERPEEVTEMTRTVRVISVTSSGRSSISMTISTASGWLAAMACAMCCSITVLPLFGEATSRPRWPLPIGAIMSMTRLVMFSSALMSRSRRRCSVGWSGVRFSKRILFLQASGDSPLILSSLTSAK